MDRRPGLLEDLPDDQADENGDAERRRARDDLERNVAEANPPPREGAAGCFRRQFGRGHASYEWIFAIVFSATTSTLFGIGTKSSFGPKAWPFVTAQKRNFFRSGALLDCCATIT